jgi:competence protein ComEC
VYSITIMPVRKVVYWGIGLILAAVFGVWWQWPDGKLHLTACDVGQGDATILEQGFNQVLVDGGPSNGKVLSCLSAQVPFWDRKLELVVVTHPQADHLGGLVEVLRRYQVGTLLVPNTSVDSDVFRSFFQEVRRLGIRVVTAEAGQKMELGKLQLKVLWPAPEPGLPLVWGGEGQELPVLGMKDEGENAVNEASVVVRASYDQFDVLLTGDIEAGIEAKLLSSGGLGGIEVLKVAHHGSKTSSTKAFLAELRPQVAIIEVGKGNRYGHPHQDVLDRLQSIGVLIERTDLLGEVEIVSDGQKFWVRGQ